MAKYDNRFDAVHMMRTIRNELDEQIRGMLDEELGLRCSIPMDQSQAATGPDTRVNRHVGRPHRAFRIVPPPRNRRLGSASSSAMRWSVARWAFHVSAAAFDSFIPAPCQRRPSGRRRAAFPRRRSTG